MKRTQRLEAEYQKYLRRKTSIGFDFDKPVMEFPNWLVIKNKFPYDRLTRTHHLLIPKERKAKFTDLPLVARKEYHVILSKLEPYYDSYLVNMPKARTVPHHWHCHLLRFK